MTKKEANKIIEVIKCDATLVGSYNDRCDGSRQCVIGGLAKAAGFDLSQLSLTANGSSISALLRPNHFGPYTRQLSNMTDTIAKKFDLSIRQMQKLQDINDRCNSTTERRRQLIAKVKEWID